MHRSLLDPDTLNVRVIGIIRFVALAFAGLLSAVSARADDYTENLGLPEVAHRAQRAALGAILVAALIGVGFYFFRRWQVTRSSGNPDIRD